MTHPQDLSLVEQAEAIARGELDATTLLTSTLTRIAERDESINSTPIVFEEQSRRMLADAPDGPLRGVPVTVKDMFALPWRAAREATRYDLIPRGASGAYRRLRDAGAVVVGVANQHEFGLGTTGSVSAYGPMGNPWDPSRSAGGSSGGSAGAVAAHLVAGSLGSDSGGSTRLPAAYCGVVGLKLTYGAMPYDGYFGSHTTFSAPGVITRNGADARLLAEALLARSLPVRDGDELRVGIVRDPFWSDVDPEVAAAGETALAESGWRVVDIEIEHLALAGAATLSRLIAEVGIPSAQVMASLSRPTRALLLAGMLLPAHYTPRADRIRGALRRSTAQAFERVDLIAWPSAPTPAPRLSDTWIDLPSGRAPADSANVRQASLANATGVPGISLPVGLHSSNMPIGLQLLAPWGEEARLLDAAQHLELVTDRRHVELVSPLARG